ncbi:MAG: kinesin motor protein cin8 [Vezdaea aestivalis]|nr:MAG: kinesin motor protein cin8 [Vezdaea aestivalis]
MARPPSARPASARSISHQSSHGHLRSAVASPAQLDAPNSGLGRTRTPPMAQQGGVKRKERDFEVESSQETNITVVVRCRGRNDREVKENSGVILSTEGARGKTVELSMGPNALSQKAYHFDRVFSPAADQAMVFDDVVAPILDEMLSGFNCTIFAYGQTGTGKTYTMSGDMADTFGLVSDSAGIIPRVLQSLFAKLEADGAESSVKCSYIELYNEDLRDLLSTEEYRKLKIYDETNRKGETATVVQGMEETHIKSASDGVKLLQDGSYKRQVAATKCNDLSSRSHTVFSVTAYVKRSIEGAEDFVSAGKLNLVDLAGSENIQRSGAENKRAAEAGLINKSLLTLGRVINALVDKSKHIPYRESKLTRILQDSLGGRTKTCIIATVSPARSNLEETISTLDYAFRAKNIRNKPQLNSLISKKTLLREFTAEIEKLKSELITTRQRNGVYLSNDAYEEMTIQNESRRILSEEQKAKIETMEANLRSKVQDLFSLTSNLHDLKKTHEGAIITLDETKSLLEQTEYVLKTTKRSLEEETGLRKAHQQTEDDLAAIGTDLLSTIGQAVGDVDGLRSKLRRRSDLQSFNRRNWKSSQAQISDVTRLVEVHVKGLQEKQENLSTDTVERIQAYVNDQLDQVISGRELLKAQLAGFTIAQGDACTLSERSRDELNNIFEGIKDVRQDLNTRIGEGLNGISTAAGRISNEVTKEMIDFQSQLHTSYSDLGQDFKRIFETMATDLIDQRVEIDRLRRELGEASTVAAVAQQSASKALDLALVEEQEKSAVNRRNLISQITELIEVSGAEHDNQVSRRIGLIKDEMKVSTSAFESAQARHDNEVSKWNEKDDAIKSYLAESKDSIKARLKVDWNDANSRSEAIQVSTKSIHEDTIQIVDSQVQSLGTQLLALDDFVSNARSENGSHHEKQLSILSELASTFDQLHKQLDVQFASDHYRTSAFSTDVRTKTDALMSSLASLQQSALQPLAELRSAMVATALREYSPTGETPPKQSYQYPTVLPRTASAGSGAPSLQQENGQSQVCSPSKTTFPPIFTDGPLSSDPASTPQVEPTTRLRELDVNAHSASALVASDKENATLTVPPSFLESLPVALPAGKRRQTGGGSKLSRQGKKRGVLRRGDGVENMEHTIPLFRGSVGTATSGVSVAGRRLRSAAVIEE